MAVIKWTYESCFQDAQKYTRKSHWVRANNAAYYAAKRHGWFEACVAHMNQDRSALTETDLKEIASRYKSRHEWKLMDKPSYTSAQRRGLLSGIANELFGEPQSKPSRKMVWTADSVLDVALKYQTRTDWAKGNPGSYAAARSLGLLEKCSMHMQVLTYNDYRMRIEKAASVFDSKAQWREGDPITYKLARKYGCIKYIANKLWAM